MSELMQAYFQAMNRIMSTVMETQAGAIEEAAAFGANAILNGGLIHAFGTGHSHMIAEEMFGRAGGLVLVNAIFEPSLMLHEGIARSSAVERLHGYVGTLLDGEPLTPGDLMIVISNAGRNAAPVEAAMYARAHGLKVVAITSMAHTLSQPPNHSSGKKLYELADVVIDNGGIPGDAAVEVPGTGVWTAATSTAIGAMIAQAIVAGVVERLAAAGMNPLPVLRSGNLEGAKAHNQAVKAAYADRLARIQAYLR